MKLKKTGKNISKIEIQGITKSGIWILVTDQEYFLPFKDYPWFKEAKLSAILKVELHHGHHLHWPELDIDLELESLIEPDKDPLVANY